MSLTLLLRRNHSAFAQFEDQSLGSANADFKLSSIDLMRLHGPYRAAALKADGILVEEVARGQAAGMQQIMSRE